MELLLLQCLQEEDSKKLMVSNVRLAEKLKMIHSDYTEYYNKKHEISSILNVDLIHIHDFMGSTSNAYVNTIKTILKRLNSRSIILYETRWKTVEKKSYLINGKTKENIVTQFATEKEKEYIADIRYDLLQSYGGSMQNVYREGKTKEFHRLYTTRLQYELGIDDAYMIYDITINKRAVETEYYKSMQKLMEELNDGQLKLIIQKMWSERNMIRLENKRDNAIIKNNANKEMSNFEISRLDINFHDNMKLLNDALVINGINKYIREQ